MFLHSFNGITGQRRTSTLLSFIIVIECVQHLFHLALLRIVCKFPFLGVFRKSPVIAPFVSSIIFYKIVFPLLLSFTPVRGGAYTSVPGPSAALPYNCVSWPWRASWCAPNYGWRTQQWKSNVDNQSIWDESEFKLRLMCRSGHVASPLQV